MSPMLLHQPILLARGFKSAGVHCGIKNERPDLAVIYSESPANAAAVYTQNAFQAAPIHITKQHLGNGVAQAMVINSGNANACTGRTGLRDAISMANQTGDALGIRPEDVIVSSTGVIGEPLEMDCISRGINEATKQLHEGGGASVAQAILTTDSGIKHAHAELTGGAQLSGIAKGSGMVHPNMATMLGLIVTDVAIPAPVLQQDLTHAIQASFNQISIDGSESTNDMVAIMANGASGQHIRVASPEHEEFREELLRMCTDLARQIAADGEGATRLMEVSVRGAPNDQIARSVSRAVARDNLVKAALHGGDPNWGRILAAAGAAWRELDVDKVQLECKSARGEAWLFKGGAPLERPDHLLDESEISFILDLDSGSAEATAWGSDLSPEYVAFNSEGRT
ncbi:MAG: bifunctional glutamate N-acetyltransferase/amino-acid acetyltransferase ArgJ [Thermoplasmatota archaeon]